MYIVEYVYEYDALVASPVGLKYLIASLKIFNCALVGIVLIVN